MRLTQQSMRAFGGGAPSDPNHKYVYHKVDSQSTTIKMPSQTDIDYQLPRKPIFSEHLAVLMIKLVGAYFTFTPWDIMIDIKIPYVKIPPIARNTPLNDRIISERKYINIATTKLLSEFDIQLVMNDG